MKPRLYKRNGLWYCAGRLMVAVGRTPAEAYTNWGTGGGRPIWIKA